MGIKGVACHAITWSNYKLADTIEDIANIGFDGLELPGEFFLSAELSWGEIKQIIGRHNISIISVYQTMRLGNKDDDVRHYELKRCEALIDLIHTLGIEYLIIGDPPTDYNDDHVVLAESLEELGAIAKSKGITLCYHPHRSSIIEKQEQIDKLLKLTSRDKVSLCLDVGHIYWSGNDPSLTLRKFIDRVGYIHFKDVRIKPLSNIEKVIEIVKSLGVNATIRAKFRHVGLMLLETKGPIITETGRGDIDFLSVIKELANLNYKGWITIELDASTLVPKLSLGRCLSHIKELLNLVASKDANV